MINAFSKGIFARWQFKDFNNENPKTNEEFKRAVEKLISSEEKTQKRFPDNRDNLDRRDRQECRQNDKRQRANNMVAAMDNKRRYNRDKKGEDLENMQCIYHPAQAKS